MRRFGEALRQVVAEPYAGEEAVAGTSALMNENRRRVFEYVAWHPCAAAAEVARALKVSGPTAAWHLAKLVDAGYAQEIRRGRRRLYHPAGLGLAPPEIAGLAALATRGAGDLVALVVRTPGLTLGRVAGKGGRLRRIARGLASAGLLATVADGRYRRYYPGGELAAIERAAPKRLRAFRRLLLRQLARDRTSPVARAAPGDVLEIDLRFGEERATIRVPTESLLAGRLG